MLKKIFFLFLFLLPSSAFALTVDTSVYTPMSGDPVTFTCSSSGNVLNFYLTTSENATGYAPLFDQFNCTDTVTFSSTSYGLDHYTWSTDFDVKVIETATSHLCDNISYEDCLSSHGLGDVCIGYGSSTCAPPTPQPDFSTSTIQDISDFSDFVFDLFVVFVISAILSTWLMLIFLR